MQNYFYAYDETKDYISLHFLIIVLDIFSVCPFHFLKFYSIALEKKTYLTTPGNVHKRILHILHTK